jgi:hypothetical protein
MSNWRDEDIDWLQPEEPVVVEDADTDRGARIDAAVALVEDGPTTADRALGVQRLGQLCARFDLVTTSARSRSTAIRQSAALALSHFTEEEVPHLLRALIADPDPRVRRAAASSIGNTGIDLFFDLMIDVVDDPGESAEVRVNALVSAARLAGDARQADEVLKRAGLDLASDHRVRARLTALGLLDDSRARDAVCDYLRRQMDSGETDELDAREAVKAVRRHPIDDRSRALLIRALDELPGARTESAHTLAKLPASRGAARP